MYYRRRRARYSTYYPYHADSTLETNFAPIIPDLKAYFFSLQSNNLKELLLHYGDKYGQSAYDYASATYSKWKNGSTKLSDKTLLRLVETLPPFIQENQRISLLEKLYDYHTPKSINNINIEMTWKNYTTSINNIIYDIKYNYPKSYQQTELPTDVLNIANWLYDNDMVVTKEILDRYAYKKYQHSSIRAIKDLLLFLNTCDTLSAQDKTYDSLTMNIKLSTINIRINILQNKKSILKSIKDIFN